MNYSSGHSDKTSITVEKEDIIGEISENLFGSFLEHVGRAIYTGIYEPDHATADKNGFRTDVIDLVKDLNVPIVRYPGGNFVSGYRWQDGIGEKASRPKRLELAWNAIETNQVGIDEFFKWSKLAGCNVMPTVNMGTGSAQDAADYVEYCNFASGTYWSDMRIKNGNRDPHAFKDWCIGNEMDGDWQICHMTASEYGRKACETIKLMKLIDKDIRVAVAGSSSPLVPTYPEWDRVVLENTYESTDHISLHRYYGFNSETDSQVDFLHSFLDLDGFIKSIAATADYVKALKRSKKTMMLSLDEWNIWHQNQGEETGKQWSFAPPILENHYNVRDALAFSGMMLTLINNADRVKIGCMAQLVNVIAPILTKTGGGVLKQTIFYPYKAGCKYAKGSALKTTVSGNRIETSYGSTYTVNTASAYDSANKELALFVLNTSEHPAETSFYLQGFHSLRQIEHDIFGGRGDLTVRNTFDHPENAVMSRIDGEKDYKEGEMTVLPGYSFHVFRFRETE